MENQLQNAASLFGKGAQSMDLQHSFGLHKAVLFRRMQICATEHPWQVATSSEEAGPQHNS